jgi:hypothetical protein
VPLAVSDFTGPNVSPEELLAAVLGTAQPLWLVDPGWWRRSRRSRHARCPSRSPRPLSGFPLGADIPVRAE